jgi:hypothetical protein
VSAPRAGSRWQALLLVTISTAGIVLAVRAERSSEARANRLHRSDALEEAAALYADRAAADTTDAQLRYNLGTTLLRLGSPAAYAQLLTASASRNERVKIRASYNLGLWDLIQALLVASDDSARVYATAAIEANKAVLRLDPDHEDAKWNLAIARLALEGATPQLNEGVIDTPNGAPNLGEIELVEGPQPFGDDQSFGDGASEGEDEALASDDLEPLTPDEAEQILGTGHLEPSTMLGKLLTREGRARRRRGNDFGGPPW